MSLLYDIFEDHAVVAKYSPEDGVDTVYIPDTVREVPVTEIAPEAFRKAENLKTVIIPMTLEVIGQEAFADCEQLACVGVSESERHSVFPPSLNYIGEMAFKQTGLQELSFASAKLVLDRFCFLASKVVSALFVGSDITFNEGAFRETNMQILAMQNAEIAHIGRGCFAFCKDLQKIRAKQVSSVGKDSFRDCVSLVEFPAKKPLDYVGDGAFYNCCSLKTEGYFRTMGDLIRAWGVDYILNETLKRKRPASSWKPEHYSAANFKVSNAVDQIAKNLKSAEYHEVTDFMLLHVIGSKYHGVFHDWNTIDLFFVYAKSDIQKHFRDVWDWNIVKDSAYGMPPYQYIGDLSKDEVHRLLQHENTPKPHAIDWGNLEMLLNAELGGDAARFSGATVTAFLSCLIEYEMGNAPDTYHDISAMELMKFISADDMNDLTDQERLHYLIWGVLYNRIAIYRELKHAYEQLTME